MYSYRSRMKTSVSLLLLPDHLRCPACEGTRENEGKEVWKGADPVSSCRQKKHNKLQAEGIHQLYFSGGVEYCARHGTGTDQ